MPIFPFFKFFKKEHTDDNFFVVPAQDLSKIHFDQSLKQQDQKKQEQQPLLDELKREVEKNHKFIMSNILMRSRQGKYAYYYQLNKDPFYHKMVALDIEDLKESGIEDIIWSYLNQLAEPFKNQGYIVNYSAGKRQLCFIWHYEEVNKI